MKKLNEEIRYSGFWQRVGAGVIDHLLCAMPFTILGPIGSWLYYAFFQSSKYQATPGMMVFSLRIEGYDGKKISFAKASGRWLATILSIMTAFIGYFMIAFTPRKQALHDYIAETLVIIEPNEN